MFDALKARAEIVDWIKLWFADKDKNSKAVIGISGGKDSTVAAALCTEALGPDRVIGVMMPNGVQEDIDDAIEVCKSLKIQSVTVNIAGSVTAIERAIEKSGLAYGGGARINTPPRSRMTILYAIAASANGYVVNTSNKCEAFIGYCTKWGDNVGDLAPLAVLIVSEVVAIGKTYKEIPVRLIEKVPADGLSGMSDEEKLGFSYDEVEECIKNWNNGKIHEVPHCREIVLAQKRNEHKEIHIPAAPISRKRVMGEEKCKNE